MYVLVDFWMTKGLFLPIGNQEIPKTMPYLVYKNGFAPSQYIKLLPFASAKPILWEGTVPKNAPVTGRELSAGLIMRIMQNYFFNKEFFEDDFWKIRIESGLVQDEYLISKLFPEAKNNPQWVLNHYEENSYRKEEFEK